VRVCFLRSEPAEVEAAAALEATGDVEVVVAERAPDGRFDVAIACDWRACAGVFDIDAQRRAALLTTLEHRTLDAAQPERAAALLALDLPLDYLVTSEWVARALADARPSARAWRITPARPEPTPPADANGRLRVAGAGPEVLAAMSEPHEEAEPPHVVVALDAGADPLAPVRDAFARGATVVASSLGGRDELLRHDANALLVEPEDLPGAAHALDRLARDRELLERLRSSAARTAAAWPDRATAGRELRETLQRVLAVDPPPAAAPGELMRHALAEVAKLAAYESARRDDLLARAQALDARETEIARRERALETDSAYQLSLRLRRAVRFVRRRRS